ncbi:VOC family protein [Dactylosporangium sp. NPDC005572]|uniref:VOC family protein n=1 Tax=Dactylosporangium sp. NPDC005572 TaxID=3156889 RepID=UPI0033AF393B
MLFHTGVVVDDLDEAMRRLGDTLGLAWATPVQRTGPISTPAGPVFRDMRITYSLGGPHHLELIEYLDDSAYRFMTGGPPLHHVGYWADDFHAEIARLESIGFPCEASGLDENGSRAEFAYHRNPHSGLWIEIVDSAGKPRFDAWTRHTSGGSRR